MTDNNVFDDLFTTKEEFFEKHCKRIDDSMHMLMQLGVVTEEQRHKLNWYLRDSFYEEPERPGSGE